MQLKRCHLKKPQFLVISPLHFMLGIVEQKRGTCEKEQENTTSCRCKYPYPIDGRKILICNDTKDWM